MTAKRFTVDSDGKYWDTVSNKYVTIDHLFYLVEKLEKENEQFKKALQVAYSTKLTEPTKHTIEQIAKHCGVDLE